MQAYLVLMIDALSCLADAVRLSTRTREYSVRTLALVLLICLFAHPAEAQRSLSILATPTSFGGEDGHVLQVDSPGDAIEEFFLIETDGLVEFLAWRQPPALFESLGGFQYLTPITTGDVVPGMSFWFIEGDCGLQLMTYMGMVELTVPAGTFMTYQFNVPDSCAAGKQQRFFWADGVGLVRQAEYSSGIFDQAWVLNSHTLNGGSGLFPRAAGNLWEYTAGSVASDQASVGTLKAKFAD